MQFPCERSVRVVQCLSMASRQRCIRRPCVRYYLAIEWCHCSINSPMASILTEKDTQCVEGNLEMTSLLFRAVKMKQ